jgi:hypothetical protein
VSLDGVSVCVCVWLGPCRQKAIEFCRPGRAYKDIGGIIEDHIKPYGYTTVRSAAPPATQDVGHKRGALSVCTCVVCVCEQGVLRAWGGPGLPHHAQRVALQVSQRAPHLLRRDMHLWCLPCHPTAKRESRLVRLLSVVACGVRSLQEQPACGGNAGGPHLHHRAHDLRGQQQAHPLAGPCSAAP